MRRLSRGLVTGLGLVLLLWASSQALEFGDKVIYAPWALHWGGGPTLEGTWEGPLHARLGAEYRLLLVLDYHYVQEVQGPSRGSTIEGRGRLCTAGGEIYDYPSLSGDADRAGQQLRLSLSYRDPSLSQLGFGLQAAWSGDTLQLARVSDNPFQPNGSFLPHRIVSTADPDDNFQPTELRRARAADFEAECRRLHAV